MTTTNLGMTLPVVGADSDTWGNELNTMFNTLDALLAGALTGLTLSAAGGTGTFGIAAGAASGATLASAYTKTTSAWAVGTGTGSLDTGAIANSTWYHVWLIQRSDTLVVDVLVSTSATSPTMPTNYDRKRRIGAMKTDGSAQWVKFVQLGDEFLWAVPINDFNSTITLNTPTLKTLSVPTGLQVFAKIRGFYGNGSVVNSDMNIVSPDETSSNSDAPTGNVTVIAQPSVFAGFVTVVRTNTSAQVRVATTDSAATLALATVGWVDKRGQ